MDSIPWISFPCRAVQTTMPHSIANDGLHFMQLVLAEKGCPKDHVGAVGQPKRAQQLQCNAYSDHGRGHKGCTLREILQYSTRPRSLIQRHQRIVPELGLSLEIWMPLMFGFTGNFSPGGRVCHGFGTCDRATVHPSLKLPKVRMTRGSSDLDGFSDGLSNALVKTALCRKTRVWPIGSTEGCRIERSRTYQSIGS